MTRRSFFQSGCLALAASAANAQREPEHDRSVVNQMRVDARDLGYSPVDVIPAGESAIRALAVAPDGAIYGATSGKRSHLFVLRPQHGYVQLLGVIAGVSTVHRSVVVSQSGDVYIGGGIGVDNNGEGYQDYPGARLLRYTAGKNDDSIMRVDAPCPTVDLGIPVPGESIYALAIDQVRNVIHGLSYPGGQLFTYSISGAKFSNHGRVAEHIVPGEKFERDRIIGRALAVCSSGAVLTSGEDGAFFRFDPEQGKLEKLGITVPTVPGREPYNRVDAWAAGEGDYLYGGGSDGYLFRLNSKTMELRNLGKPLNQYRVRGLVLARNGKLYGVGGDDDEMARLFSYDPGRGVFELLGFIDVNRRPYYSWQAYVIDAMAIGDDGIIYLGQSERKSKLYVYYPA
jgi:hypothetical protein